MAAAIALLMATEAHAQFGFFNDVARTSASRPMGSGRTLGMGGVGQALGGDVSAFTTNPAGLGWYNHTEIALGLGLTNSNANTSYLNSRTGENATNINIPTLAWIYASESEEDDKFLKGWTIGVGLSRQQDFNQHMTWNGLSLGANDQGMSVANGLVQHFLKIADDNLIGPNILRQTELFPLEQQIRGAYGIYMLDSLNNQFATFMPPADYQQQMTQKQRGHRMTLDLGAAINLADRGTIGITIGPAFYNHVIERAYEETVADVYYSTSNPILSDSTYRGARFRYNDKTATSGIGMSVRIGGQYNITDRLRWGGTVTLPTVYGVNQVYDFTMDAVYPNTIQTTTRNNIRTQTLLPRNPGRPNIVIPAILYTVTTPWQLSTGLAYRWGKSALVSADVDYVDYSSATIGSSEFNPRGDNDAVKLVYQSAINYRLGAEYRVSEWRFRAGYAFFGSPYKSDIELGYYLHRGLHVPSAGVGYRNKDRYFDVGMNYTLQTAANTAHTYTTRATSDVGFLGIQAVLGFMF